jgi:beta-N-acetylhexosaminidase
MTWAITRARTPATWAATPAAALTVALAAGCSGAASASPGSHSTGSDRPASVATSTAGNGGSASSAGRRHRTLPRLPQLTNRQLAGQRVIYSYSGLTPPAELLARIRSGQVAGVIFFGGNISSQAQLAKVAAELQQAAKSNSNPVRQPLLLMTDQEGGKVRRLPGGPAKSEKEVGLSVHPASAARNAGRVAAANLRGAGLNVNLAPVLDVYRKAGNFIDEFGRSYSRDPAIVSQLGTDFIQAQQGKGVAATAKHFPGLGAAARTENTDERPVTLNLTKTQIRSVDELPYRQAITAGTKLIMVSWASYPSLGTKRPAGLASIVVNGELRKRLGYTGVTITDALEAGALKPYGGTSQRAIMAATAGMDLILCSVQNPSQGIDAVTALTGAYRDGTLDRTKFRDAARRILALRMSLPG